MERRVHRFPHASAEIVRQLLAIARGDDVPIRMTAEIPGREVRRGNQALAVPRWKRKDQPPDLAALDRLQLTDDDIKERRQFERRIVREA